MSDQAVIVSEAACPRCGYDQRGAHEAWQRDVAAEGDGACCPMRGVCSECGLEFGWGSVLNPQLAATNWLFEHVRGWWRVLAACWKNGWSSLFAWRWWKRVRMEHAVRPWRMAVYWVVWLVAAEVGLGVVGACARMWSQWWYTSEMAKWRGTASVWNEQFTTEFLLEGWRGLYWPWGTALRYRGGYSVHGAFDTGDMATIGLLLPVFMACAFLLLPVTMRTMRVRKVHLLRGAGHAAPVAALGLAAWAVVVGALNGLALTRPFGYIDSGLLGPPDRVLFTALAVWLFSGLWWWRFTRDYLRLPRAGWVAGLLLVVALLAAVLACRPVQYGVVWVWELLRWMWAGAGVRVGR